MATWQIATRAFWLLALIGVGQVRGATQTARPVDQVASRLDTRIKQSRVRREELAVLVTLVHNGKSEIVYRLRDDQAMIPASLTKILTAGAVLDGLGPSRKLETRLMVKGEVREGVLFGDLYLVGGGDPGFVSETMWFLVNEFLRTGIKKVTGRVVVDDSRFDRVRSDSTRSSERVDRAFDAPVGAMSFNWNSVNVYVRPAEGIGQPARVFLDPENAYSLLAGEVRTVRGGKSDIQISRIDGGPEKDVIRVSGQIGFEASEFVAYKNITAPDLWSGQNLIAFLKQRDIQVLGGVATGKVPEGARQVARAESKPMAALVTDMMKFSNNFVAEMLVKNLAAEQGGQASGASLARGLELVRKFIVEMGVPADQFTLVNPSGFSRENRITARDLNKILVHIRERFGIFPEVLASFPVAGIDGTLKSRMKGSAAAGRVRAKTGLLNGVAGLAGYAGRTDGSQLSFVFLFNGRPDLGEDARQLFDLMAAELVQ